MPIFPVAFSSREMLVKRKILFLLIVVRRINFPYLDTNFSLYSYIFDVKQAYSDT